MTIKFVCHCMVAMANVCNKCSIIIIPDHKTIDLRTHVEPTSMVTMATVNNPR